MGVKSVIHPNITWPPLRPVMIQPTTSPLVVDPLQQMEISPDFSTFVARKRKVENRRPREEPPPLDDLQMEPMRRRKKSVEFEDIVKEIEEERAQRSVSRSPEPSLAPERLEEVVLSDEDVFTENEQAKAKEAREVLTRLFEKLLTDIYGTRELWAAEELKRRSSDTKIIKFRKPFKGELYRQLSQPCCRPGCTFLPNRVPLSPIFNGILGVNRFSDFYSEAELESSRVSELTHLRKRLQKSIEETGNELIRELKTKDDLRREQEELCQIVTASLQATSNKTSDDARVKFSLSPVTQDSSGFQEWARAMRMVARLPDGVPSHFRKNLWLSLAERHLNSKGVVWSSYEKKLFSETTNAEDQELSVQIVKDLHRTGCSLFCGATGQHNQAVLKRVLLAYARWNKNVGYCQGLNMLAALILQVMQGSQSATVKVMIYLIEGVLPESYFANNLRGLSVDMAVFRDLLRLRLPSLATHLSHLQTSTSAKTSSSSYEPPLCDVFTMQWFLTLFSNCLPQSTVLRVWDLVFLEGDSIVLRTSLAVWQSLSDRLMAVKSADEFYSIMAVLTREMMEFGLMEPNSLIRAIDALEIPEMTELREKYTYNISPWAVGTVAKMGAKLFYPESPPLTEDAKEPPKSTTPFSNHPDREKIALDISALKKQYWKLRERQRQAHIILSACRTDSLSPSNSPTALNHLLMGKTALLTPKGRRIFGTVPEPVRPQQAQFWSQPQAPIREREPTPDRSESSSSSSSTELCDTSESSDSEDDFEEDPSPPLEAESPHPEAESPPLEPESPPTELESTSQQPKRLETDGAAGPSPRRQSELALLQILQENSQILRRIHLNSSKKSTDEEEPEEVKPEVSTSDADEPEDIKEIRRRWAQSAT